MSEQPPLDPVHDALTALAGEGSMVVGYYVVGEVITPEGKRSWLADYPTDQSLVYSLGVINWARLTLEAEAASYFDRLQIAAMELEDDEGDDE